MKKKPITPRRRLTAKQENFCQYYVGSKLSVKEAYKKAYNCVTASDESISSSAKKLMNLPHMELRMEELREKAWKENSVTIKVLTAELEEAIQMARLMQNPTAMINATMAKAKLHGLDIQKIEAKHTIDPIGQLLKEVDGTSITLLE